MPDSGFGPARAPQVCQVVDVRDPLRYRCEDLEDYVLELSEAKGSLLLLNKADMLSPQLRREWAKCASHPACTRCLPARAPPRTWAMHFRRSPAGSAVLVGPRALLLLGGATCARWQWLRMWLRGTASLLPCFSSS